MQHSADLLALRERVTAQRTTFADLELGGQEVL